MLALHERLATESRGAVTTLLRETNNRAVERLGESPGGDRTFWHLWGMQGSARSLRGSQFAHETGLRRNKLRRQPGRCAYLVEHAREVTFDRHLADRTRVHGRIDFCS